MDRPIGTGVGAKAAVQFLVRRDSHVLPGEPRENRKQAAVRAEPTTIRPSVEHSEQDEPCPDGYHVKRPRETEDADEGVPFTNQEAAGYPVVG